MPDPSPRDKAFRCPKCHGTGAHSLVTIYVAMNGARKCPTCNGEGEISQEVFDAIEAGERLRIDRISRNVSLREEAQKRGLTPRELSDVEHGKVSGA